YDAAGQLTTSVSVLLEGWLNYGYDATGELTSVNTGQTATYSYDLAGNRTMSGYTSGTDNRLTSDGTYNYTYDNEGNVLTKPRLSDGQQTVDTWDYRKRLTDVQVKNSGGTVQFEERFTYDVYDRRTGVWVDADGS